MAVGAPATRAPTTITSYMSRVPSIAGRLPAAVVSETNTAATAGTDQSNCATLGAGDGGPHPRPLSQSWARGAYTGLHFQLRPPAGSVSVWIREGAVPVG